MPGTHRIGNPRQRHHLATQRRRKCAVEPLESRTLLSVVFPPMPMGPGGPNAGFGSGGLVSHPEPGFSDTSGLALQGDKSIIIGPFGPVGSREFGVTRFNADGSYDQTFGDNGVVYTSFGGDDVPTAIQVLPDGFIVVVGTDTTAGGSQFALAKYDNFGNLDPHFGNGAGKVLTSFSSTPGTLSNDVVNDVLAGPDGTLYLAGSSDADGRQRDFAVAEYGPDGELTSAHGGAGKLLIDFSGGDDQVSAIAMLPNGGLLLAGSTTPAGSDVSRVALARLVPNGGLDPHFGNGGQVVTSVGSVDDAASSVVGDQNNNIFVAGHTGTGSAEAGTLSSDFLLLCYTGNGQLDRAFGHGGAAETAFHQPAAASRVLELPGGKIVVSGKTTADLASLSSNGLDLAVAQYQPNGQLDKTFDTTGAVIIHLATGSTTSVSNASTGAARRRTGKAPPPAAGDSDTAAELEAEFQVLITSSEGAIAVTSGGQLLAVGTDSDGTTEASLSTSGVDLSLALSAKLPASVIAGAAGVLSLTISELGSDLASGTATVNLYFSTTADVESGQPFKTISSTIELKTGNSASIKSNKFTYSTTLADGDYYIVATVSLANATDIDTGNNTAASTSTVHVAQPFIDLAGPSFTAPVFKTGKSSNLLLHIANDGNEIASGTMQVQLLASTDGTLASATALATLPAKLKLKAGASGRVTEKLSLPATLPSGNYVLLALIDASDIFNDTNLTNNLLASSNRFAVG